MAMKIITRTVWILSIVSLFTDIASEMLYPVMPIYLKSIGFSILFIGLLEGFAEATTGISKGYFGQLSDSTKKRMPFIQIGYGLSAISKPMMAFLVYPIWIFFARTMDRFGKGVRTSARDALLSDQSTPSTKGTVFGFHRTMDTFGAAIGPLVALVYLYFYPQHYKALFIIAFIPGLIAFLASLLLKDKVIEIQKPKEKIKLFSFLGYWKRSSLAYKKLLIGLLIFTLFNSSDVFLLLKVKQAGFDDKVVIGIYIFYNLIYAIFSLPFGVLADKVGLKKILVLGLFLFSIVYLTMSISNNYSLFIVAFFIYGLYSAATEGISKALISNISNQQDTATAIGTFSGLQSICLMLSSSIAGWVWYQFGASFTFMLTGIVTLIVVLYFLTYGND